MKAGQIRFFAFALLTAGFTGYFAYEANLLGLRDYYDDWRSSKALPSSGKHEGSEAAGSSAAHGRQVTPAPGVRYRKPDPVEDLENPASSRAPDVTRPVVDSNDKLDSEVEGTEEERSDQIAKTASEITKVPTENSEVEPLEAPTSDPEMVDRAPENNLVEPPSSEPSEKTATKQMPAKKTDIPVESNTGLGEVGAELDLVPEVPALEEIRLMEDPLAQEQAYQELFEHVINNDPDRLNDPELGRMMLQKYVTDGDYQLARETYNLMLEHGAIKGDEENGCLKASVDQLNQSKLQKILYKRRCGKKTTH